MALKFYTSVEKKYKLKVRKCLGLIPTFVEVTGEKLVGDGRSFCLSWIGLRRITRMENKAIFMEKDCNRFAKKDRKWKP